MTDPKVPKNSTGLVLPPSLLPLSRVTESQPTPKVGQSKRENQMRLCILIKCNLHNFFLTQGLCTELYPQSFLKFWDRVWLSR